MFIRFNSTVNIWEYDTSAGQTGAGPWLILPNTVYKDKDNNFTLGQHINTSNAALTLNNTTGAADQKIFRILSGGGNLFIDALNDAQNAVQGEVYITRNGTIHSDGGIIAVGGFAGPNYNFVNPIASSNPTVLDYYEEGSWTPTFDGDVTHPSGATYNGQIGRYVRIGNVVNCNFILNINNIGTGGGTLYITGFPFANSPTLIAGGVLTHFTAIIGAVISINPIMFVGTAALALYYKNSSSPGMDGLLRYESNIQTGTQMIGAVSYMVS